MTRLLLFAFLLMATFARAQNAPLPVLCGNDAFDYILRHKYPDLHQAFQASFEENLKRAPAVSNRSPLTIRMVVHVVWKNPEENLADSIILSQIAVLNEDYNRENADTANLRPVFQPVAGNPQIKFELAEIVRVKTTGTFKLNLSTGDLMSNLKSGNQGGSDPWDPSAYLNLWICKIQPLSLGGIPLGQILGFAFPPNNLSHWPADSGAPTANQDGVALDFRVVGRNNPNTVEIPGGTGNLVVRGRTATHEIGHYLGLRHIWGDGGLLGLPNDCDQSDGIDDTPFANAQSAFDCDTSRNTCAQVEPFYGMDVPDLVENYMDYASESCMNMFTRGQVNMLQSVLAGPRSGLVQASSGTAQTAPEAQPKLYPNPTRESVRLYIPADWPAITAIDIAGVDGRIQALPLPPGTKGGQVDLDTRNWPAGWYVVRVQTANGVWTERLVVMR